MIVRGIRLGIEVDGIDFLRRLYTYEGSPEFLHNYLSWDDERLVKEILDDGTKRGYAKSIFERLSERRLFKEILNVRLKELDALARKALLEAADANKEMEVMKEIEKAVADTARFDEHLVIAKVVRQKSAAQTEGSILVERPDSSVREFREESTLFASIDSAIQDQYLSLYASIEWKDPADKRRKREQFEKELVPLINDLLKAHAGLVANENSGRQSNEN